MSADLDQIVADVARSRRYRHVCRDAVARLARSALAASGGDVRAATKRTKSSLHQIFGAFVPAPLDPARTARELRDAAGDPDAIKAALLRAMQRHASTRERVPILESLWREVTARTGPAGRVLDLGCGLNPLAAPWMTGLATELYCGVELDTALVALVQEALSVIGVPHDIQTRDVLSPGSLPSADLVIAMKLLPTLDQQLRGSGLALLAKIDAPTLVVSFPRRSLSGRSKGMTEHYAGPFEAEVSVRGWSAERVELSGELVYVVRRAA